MSLTRKMLLVLASAAVLILARPGGDQPLPAAPPAAEKSAPAKDTESKEREVQIRSKDGTATYDDSTGTWIVTDALLIVPDSDAQLTASRIEYNKTERWAKATGKPHMWDTRNEMTSDVMRLDLNAKRFNAEGTVRMVVRPKEAKGDKGRKAREDIKEPVVINCDEAQYFYKDKKGTATGNLRMTQKDARADRTGTAKRLAYDGNDETVTLDGDVNLSNTKGEHFKCTEATIIMKEGSEGLRMKGFLDGLVFGKDEDTGSSSQPGGGSKEKPSTPAAEKPKPAPPSGEQAKPAPPAGGDAAKPAPPPGGGDKQ